MAPPPATPGVLAGRTIQVVSDMSLVEQLYLFERARRLKAKAAVQRNLGGQGGLPGPAVAGASEPPPLCEVLDADVPEKVDNRDSTVYLVFMEGSTRTRESIRNAAIYHGVKVNEFQAETSSFQKNETITDTMKMLSVYSTERSVFVIRSALEGVCRWLQNVMPAHTERFGIPTPAFLNAGDGRFSHPISELVDDFSLLEQLSWERSAVHVALVGDLAHGRTAHSKVDGLKVFNKARVDLVAPSAFTYPVEYRNRMRENGFEVREFSSVEEYLKGAKGSLATIWYFYQPQFKRCGDLPTGAIAELREKVTFKAEWQSQLPPESSFFQTLPRDKENPIVPLALDATSLNCWDRHASNAYFLHVVLLGMLFGKIGHGLPAPEEESPTAAEAAPLKLPAPVDSEMSRKDSAPSLHSVYPFADGVPACLPAFLEAVDLNVQEHQRRPERARPGGAVPIKDGLVVDHIGRSLESPECWQRLRMVRTILGWSKLVGSEGVYESTALKSKNVMKGIMSLPNFEFEKVTVPQMKVLASVAPGCTINAIKASKVVSKYRLTVPERIYSLANISCRNRACVSNPVNKQRDVVAFFEREPFYETSVLPNCQAAEYLFVCKYCKWPHRYEDIWNETLGHFDAAVL